MAGKRKFTDYTGSNQETEQTVNELVNDIISSQAKEKTETGSQYKSQKTGNTYSSQKSGNTYSSQSSGFNKKFGTNINDIPKILLPAFLGRTVVPLPQLTNEIPNLNEILNSGNLRDIGGRRFITTYRGGTFNIIPSLSIENWNELSNTYPFYKLTYIQFQFTPKLNVMDKDTGTFITVVDRTSIINEDIKNSPFNYSRILKSQRKKEHSTVLGKKGKRSLKPSILESKRILTMKDNTQKFVDINVPLYNQYLETKSYGNASYLGLRWGWKTDREIDTTTSTRDKLNLIGGPFTQIMDVNVVILYAFKYFI